MSLPSLTAEAAVYRTGYAYKTDPAAGRGTAASVAPATVADRIAGLEAVWDYIDRMDFTLLKQKLALPPSWGGRSWTPAHADAAVAKYKKWLFLQRRHEDVVLSPGPPDREINIVWLYHILDTEAYIRDTAQIFGWYLHHPPDFGSMENDVPQYTRQLFRAEFGEELVPGDSGEASPPTALHN
jgi:hypothetical protein